MTVEDGPVHQEVALVGLAGRVKPSRYFCGLQVAMASRRVSCARRSAFVNLLALKPSRYLWGFTARRPYGRSVYETAALSAWPALEPSGYHCGGLIAALAVAGRG